jgi:hypothetical protein
MTQRRIGLRFRIPGIAAAAAVLLSAVVSFSASAGASTAAPHRLRTEPCLPSTFNVYYGAPHPKCFRGPGEGFVRIPGVHLIKTGINSGYFRLEFRPGQFEIIFFYPRQTKALFRQRPELLFLHINR